MSTSNHDFKKTPLYNKHVEARARMMAFSGWEMPVQYTGIIEEHLHARSKAGLFDICHMGEFFLKGPSVEENLDKLVTCGIKGMNRGKCRYGFLLKENGGIIDDLVVFKISREEYMLVVNAGTLEKDAKWIREHLSPGNEFSDKSSNIAKIDLQGPLSPKIVSSLFDRPELENLKRFSFTHVDWDGTKCPKGTKIMVSATGYTGEKGYEFFLAVQAAEEVWDALLGFDGVKPVGLGARDTLRLEMGYSLYGHDIDEGHTPLEANLGRFVDMKKAFIGKERLLRQQEEGFSRILTGFVCEGRRSAREHYSVTADNAKAGEVTSGVFSPCLKKGIGLCYIDRKLAIEGREITITDGRVEIRARIKKPPFIQKG